MSLAIASKRCCPHCGGPVINGRVKHIEPCIPSPSPNARTETQVGMVVQKLVNPKGKTIPRV